MRNKSRGRAISTSLVAMQDMVSPSAPEGAGAVVVDIAIAGDGTYLNRLHVSQLITTDAG